MTRAPQPCSPTAVPSTLTVRVKPCGCGAIQGDQCDCAEFAAEAKRLFAPQPAQTQDRRPDHGAPCSAPPTTQGAPLLTTEELPRYGFETLLVMAGLANQPMLNRDRRQLAPGQKPVACYWSGHADVLLYKAADAVDMPPLSPGRQRRYDEARTCAACGERSKFTFEKGRDRNRYCQPCQEPAAKRLFLAERAADRPLITEWAAGVIDDPNVILGAYGYHQYWTEMHVQDLAGTVLISTRARHNVRDVDPEHPHAAELAELSPRRLVDQFAALAGRRLLSWTSSHAPRLDTEWDEFGQPTHQATRVAHGDEISPWWNRWVGKPAGSSYRHNPWLEHQPTPWDPQESINLMRHALAEMASGKPAQAATPSGSAS